MAAGLPNQARLNRGGMGADTREGMHLMRAKTTGASDDANAVDRELKATARTAAMVQQAMTVAQSAIDMKNEAVSEARDGTEPPTVPMSEGGAAAVQTAQNVVIANVNTVLSTLLDSFAADPCWAIFDVAALPSILTNARANQVNVFGATFAEVARPLLQQFLIGPVGESGLVPFSLPNLESRFEACYNNKANGFYLEVAPGATGTGSDLRNLDGAIIPADETPQQNTPTILDGFDTIGDLPPIRDGRYKFSLAPVDDHAGTLESDYLYGMMFRLGASDLANRVWWMIGLRPRAISDVPDGSYIAANRGGPVGLFVPGYSFTEGTPVAHFDEQVFLARAIELSKMSMREALSLVVQRIDCVGRVIASGIVFVPGAVRGSNLRYCDILGPLFTRTWSECLVALLRARHILVSMIVGSADGTGGTRTLKSPVNAAGTADAPVAFLVRGIVHLLYDTEALVNAVDKAELVDFTPVVPAAAANHLLLEGRASSRSASQWVAASGLAIGFINPDRTVPTGHQAHAGLLEAAMASPEGILGSIVSGFSKLAGKVVEDVAGAVPETISVWGGVLQQASEIESLGDASRFVVDTIEGSVVRARKGISEGAEQVAASILPIIGMDGGGKDKPTVQLAKYSLGQMVGVARQYNKSDWTNSNVLKRLVAGAIGVGEDIATSGYETDFMLEDDPRISTAQVVTTAKSNFVTWLAGLSPNDLDARQEALDHIANFPDSYPHAAPPTNDQVTDTMAKHAVYPARVVLATAGVRFGDPAIVSRVPTRALMRARTNATVRNDSTGVPHPDDDTEEDRLIRPQRTGYLAPEHPWARVKKLRGYTDRHNESHPHPVPESGAQGSTRTIRLMSPFRKMQTQDAYVELMTRMGYAPTGFSERLQEVAEREMYVPQPLSMACQASYILGSGQPGSQGFGHALVPGATGSTSREVPLQYRGGVPQARVQASAIVGAQFNNVLIDSPQGGAVHGGQQPRIGTEAPPTSATVPVHQAESDKGGYGHFYHSTVIVPEGDLIDGKLRDIAVQVKLQIASIGNINRTGFCHTWEMQPFTGTTPGLEGRPAVTNIDYGLAPGATGGPTRLGGRADYEANMPSYQYLDGSSSASTSTPNMLLLSPLIWAAMGGVNYMLTMDAAGDNQYKPFWVFPPARVNGTTVPAEWAPGNAFVSGYFCPDPADPVASFPANLVTTGSPYDPFNTPLATALPLAGWTPGSTMANGMPSVARYIPHSAVSSPNLACQMTVQLRPAAYSDDPGKPVLDLSGEYTLNASTLSAERDCSGAEVGVPPGSNVIFSVPLTTDKQYAPAIPGTVEAEDSWVVNGATIEFRRNNIALGPFPNLPEGYRSAWIFTCHSFKLPSAGVDTESPEVLLPDITMHIIEGSDRARTQVAEVTPSTLEFEIEEEEIQQTLETVTVVDEPRVEPTNPQFPAIAEIDGMTGVTPIMSREGGDLVSYGHPDGTLTDETLVGGAYEQLATAFGIGGAGFTENVATDLVTGNTTFKTIAVMPQVPQGPLAQGPNTVPKLWLLSTRVRADGYTTAPEPDVVQFNQLAVLMNAHGAYLSPGMVVRSQPSGQYVPTSAVTQNPYSNTSTAPHMTIAAGNVANWHRSENFVAGVVHASTLIPSLFPTPTALDNGVAVESIAYESLRVSGLPRFFGGAITNEVFDDPAGQPHLVTFHPGTDQTFATPDTVMRNVEARLSTREVAFAGLQLSSSFGLVWLPGGAIGAETNNASFINKSGVQVGGLINKGPHGQPNASGLVGDFDLGEMYPEFQAGDVGLVAIFAPTPSTNGATDMVPSDPSTWNPVDTTAGGMFRMVNGWGEAIAFGGLLQDSANAQVSDYAVTRFEGFRRESAILIPFIVSEDALRDYAGTGGRRYFAVQTALHSEGGVDPVPAGFTQLDFPVHVYRAPGLTVNDLVNAISV